MMDPVGDRKSLFEQPPPRPFHAAAEVHGHDLGTVLREGTGELAVAAAAVEHGRIGELFGRGLQVVEELALAQPLVVLEPGGVPLAVDLPLAAEALVAAAVGDRGGRRGRLRAFASAGDTVAGEELRVLLPGVA